MQLNNARLAQRPRALKQHGPACSVRLARPLACGPARRPSSRQAASKQQLPDWQHSRRTLVQLVCSASEEAAASTSSEVDGIPPEEEDFDLLSTKIADLVAELNGELKGCSIYLIGMMGTGKSTLGKMLANTLRYAFFDTDMMIEKAHDDRSVADLWKEHGEAYFRQCETQVLKELAPYKNLVVATGGGAVTNPMNWSYMHNGIVAWLNGESDLLARRIVAQGPSTRPLVYSEDVAEDAMYEYTLDKVQALMEARHKYYVNADVVVDLAGAGRDEATGAPTAVVMYRLLEAVRDKIAATKAEREAKRQFTIEDVSKKVEAQQPLPSFREAEQKKQEAEE